MSGYDIDGFVRTHRKIPAHLEAERIRIQEIARGYGLDFFETVFLMCSFEEINMLAAYGGFPTRYPHWRFGMEYLEMDKGYEYGLQKIYEMVINTDPSYAYLLDNNTLVDQKLVMAHVYGHVDFFKNNAWFQGTNRKMLDQMANHATRVRRYIDRHGHDAVESWIDVCLSIDNLIDPHSVHIVRERDRSPEELEAVQVEDGIHKLPAKKYMDKFINPPEFLAEQAKKRAEERKKLKNFPEEPQRDVLKFLIRYANLPAWKADVLSIIREEAYYFAPQAQTKVMNEGWACLLPGTLVFTDRGLVSMGELVGGAASAVYDGRRRRAVYDRNIIPDHDTVRLSTRRGLIIEGSSNHRVLLADGETWRRLDALSIGDRIALSGGGGMWAREVQRIGRAAARGVARTQVVPSVAPDRSADGALVACGGTGDVAAPCAAAVPEYLTADFAAFLGILIGCGSTGWGVGSTDHRIIERFVSLSEDLFGLTPLVERDGDWWSALLGAAALRELLEGLLTPTEGAAGDGLPAIVLRSPEPVVRAFLRAWFDCAGYAGQQGLTLSALGGDLAREVQLVLMNYGILSDVRRGDEGGYSLHVTGADAARFADRVGFGSERKQGALLRYSEAHRGAEPGPWVDEVVGLEAGRADVYDISVAETHRYAAGGLINHNSYWHTRMMTHDILDASEVIEYADHHSGTVATRPGQFNPYKLGLELYRHIERRWDKGQFGKEWLDCDDHRERKRWDTNAMLGRKKIFEVRRVHNDITFIDEFLTEDFVREQGLFTWEFDKKANEFVISSRDFHEVKQRLLFMLSNRGQPRIAVVDGNHANRGELVLRHTYEGMDMQLQWAEQTMKNLVTIWGRPVHLETFLEGKPHVLHHDGTSFSKEKIKG